MTKKQRRELKLWRQNRKALILHMARNADPKDRSYFANTLGAIQDGKYTGRGTSE